MPVLLIGLNFNTECMGSFVHLIYVCNGPGFRLKPSALKVGSSDYVLHISISNGAVS